MFIKLKKSVEVQPGKKIKVLRTDIKWYTCYPFLQVYQHGSLKWHLMMRYTSVAKHIDHTLLEKAWCILSTKHIQD